MVVYTGQFGSDDAVLQATLGPATTLATVYQGVLDDELLYSLVPIIPDVRFSYATITDPTTLSLPFSLQGSGGDVVYGHVSNLPAGDYNIHIGVLGSTEDAAVFSAIAGRGQTITIDANGYFIFASPPFTDTDPLAITFYAIESEESYTRTAAFTPFVRPHRTQRYQLYRHFAPTFSVLARSVREDHDS